jgi:hypothetical protein
MKEKPVKSVFENEAALCAAFIGALPDGWTAYAETAGFDILLVRGSDGAQIGVEAKMTLNAKVLMQAVEGMYSGHGSEYGAPDFRAALVPYGTAGVEMRCLANYLGVTVIQCRAPGEGEQEIERKVELYGAYYRKHAAQEYQTFKPELPVVQKYEWRESWVDHCPVERCKVPDYVPDVAAGASGPSQLSEWKIKAIKICVILERRAFVTIADFKHIRIDRKRWLDFRWLQPTEQRGKYVRGSIALDLRAAHPINFAQIEADYEKWKPADDAPVTQAALL